MTKPVARLTSPAQLVASLPEQLGYIPTESFPSMEEWLFRSETKDAIWWDNNKPMAPAHFEVLLEDFKAFAKDTERRIPIALGKVAQYLIVGTVFLDDVNDMLEHARLPDAFGHGARRLVRSRWQPRFPQQSIAHVTQRNLGHPRQLPFTRHGYQ